MQRAEILSSVQTERERQFDLPGSEFDMRNTPSDWVALAAHYLCSEVRRGGRPPEADAFEDHLIKAAAILLAAIEHIPQMRERGLL